MANEKRLIDANALMDAFRKYMVERHDKIKCASEENCKVCDRPCLWRRVVSDAPTVDAVEVVHGYWVILPDDYFDLVEMKCSVCGESWGFEEYEDCIPQNYHYCPNCGAKMDGDGNA